MSAKTESLDKLDYAITALNQDAGSLHQLISQSTDELKKATKVGSRAAENADKVIESLEPLTDRFGEQINACKSILKETKDAQANLVSSLEESIEQSFKKQDEAFNGFSTKMLVEGEKTRDTLQSDLLASKNNMSTRLDSLETEVSKLAQTLKDSNEEIVSRTQGAITRLYLLLSAAAAFGVVNLVCLVLLLLR